jgi:hypothetical protein
MPLALQSLPQSGMAQRIQTLGDKIMTPVWYQNLGGTESLWADQTVMVAGPSAVRWYQFNFTGGFFPATPVQQQTFDNGGDGLWRFMPSIAADQNGNVGSAIRHRAPPSSRGSVRPGALPPTRRVPLPKGKP